MKNLLIITMLLGVGYSQEHHCDESNWEYYYIYEEMAGCWLSSAVLHSVSFYNANLQGADLSGAGLSYANFTGTNLTGASLIYANLEQADFTGADLTGASLTGAQLLRSEFEGANLAYANLTGANLEYADLSGACLEGAINFTQTDYYGTPLLEGCAFLGGECSFEDTDEDGYDDASYEAGANSADPCYGVVCDDDPEMICICGECGYEDEQGDTGGDDSYEAGYDDGYVDGAISGDLNLDGTDNVLDVVMLVDNILNP